MPVESHITGGTHEGQSAEVERPSVEQSEGRQSATQAAGGQQQAQPQAQPVARPSQIENYTTAPAGAQYVLGNEWGESTASTSTVARPTNIAGLGNLGITEEDLRNTPTEFNSAPLGPTAEAPAPASGYETEEEKEPLPNEYEGQPSAQAQPQEPQAAKEEPPAPNPYMRGTITERSEIHKPYTHITRATKNGKKTTTTSVNEEQRRQAGQAFANINHAIENDLTAQTGDSPVPELFNNPNFVPEEDLSRALFAPTRDDLKKREKVEQAAKQMLGSAVYGKLHPDAGLGLRDISISIEFLRAAMAEPGNQIIAQLNILAQMASPDVDLTSLTTAEEVMREVNRLANSGIPIKVLTMKSPVNDRGSVQRRILRIHDGDYLIRVHPLAAKAYNADFDGDDINVQFKADDDTAIRVSSPIDMLIGIDGEPMLDPSFFPMPIIDKKTLKESDLRKNLHFRAGFDSEIVNAITELGTADNEKTALLNLIRAVNRHAMRQADNHEYRDEIVAAIIEDIYDVLQHVQQIRAQAAMVESEYHYQLPKEKTALDRACAELIDLACTEKDTPIGNKANNYMDMKVHMHRFLGDVEGTNASFRISAEFAKLIKWDPRQSISSKNYDKFLDKMSSFLYSLKMSSRVNAGAREKHIADEFRDEVIAKVGMPISYHGNFSAFLTRFYQVYTQKQAEFDLANVDTYTDFQMRDKDKKMISHIGGPTIGEIRKALKNVYGKFTVIEMFGERVADDGGTSYAAMDKNGNGLAFDVRLGAGRDYDGTCINKRWAHRTLASIAHVNDMQISKKNINEKLKQNLFEYYMKDKDNPKNVELARDMFWAIADLATGREDRYHDELTKKKDGVFAQMLTLVQEINQVVQSDVDDKSVWLEKQTKALYLFNPDMFHYYHMDTPRGFVKGKYFKQMLNAKTVDEMGGIYLSMLIEYRTSEARDMQQHVKNFAKENTHIKKNDKRYTIAYERAINRQEAALDKLASSSDTWGAIVRELRSGRDSWFYTIREREIAGKENKEISGNSLLRNDLHLRVKNLYYNGYADLKHDDLYSTLLDPTIGFDAKSKILGDMLRCYTLSPYARSMSAPYQLQMNPYSATSVRSFADDDGIMDTIAYAGQNFKSYYKNRFEAAQANYYNAYKDFRKGREYNDSALTDTIRLLFEDPVFFVNINRKMFADAALATLDKTYDTSEKSSQQPGTSSIYQANVLRRTGRMSSDVTQTDNDAVGIKQDTDITSRDLLEILAYPGRALYVYGESGQVEMITRKTLCGDNSEQALWDFFQSNPSLFLHVRGLQANVIGGRDAHVYLSAAGNSSEALAQATMNPNATNPRMLVYHKLQAEMWDSPNFYGMVVMMTPTAERNSRSMRSTILANESRMVRAIMELASLKKLNEDQGFLNDKEFIEEYVSTFLGVTANDIVEAGMDETTANALFGELCNNFNRYSDLALKISSDTGYDISTVRVSNPPDWPKPDLQSYTNYFDTRQEMSGAKTEVSTGIEGSETYKIAVWISLLNTKDSYADLAALDRDEIRQFLIGSTTLDGQLVTEENLDKILDALAPNQDLIVKVGDDQEAPDPTLDSYGKQMSSTSRWIMIKRDKGAEKFNLKAKKLGTDGLDSISKILRGSVKNSGEVRQKLYFDVNKAYKDTLADTGDAEKARDAAVTVLAEQLKNANEYLRQDSEKDPNRKEYEELNLANYMSIANIMIRVEGNNDHVSIRSLEQLAYAVRNQLSYDTAMNDGIKGIRAAAQAIADGVSGDFVIHKNQSSFFSKMRIAGKSPYTGNLRESSSSTGRNWQLIRQISEETKIRANNNIDNFDSDLANEGREILERYLSKDSYRILGEVGKLIPQAIGARNAVVMDKWNAEDLEIARERGLTVLVKDPNNAIDDDDLMENLVTIKPASIGQNGELLSPEWALIPFFDMRLNGAYVSSEIAIKSSTWRADEGAVCLALEDTSGYWAQGDAKAQIFSALLNRFKVNDSGAEEFSVADLFGATIDMLINEQKWSTQLEAGLLSREELEKTIIENHYPVTIDYGIPQNHPDFQRRKQSIDAAIETYRQRYRDGSVDKDGFLNIKAKPGDVIGFAYMTIGPSSEVIDGERIEKVLTPIIMFPSWQGSFSAPNDYDLVKKVEENGIEKDGTSYDKARNTFTVNWKWSGSVKNAAVKYFDGSSASNKLTAAFSDTAPSPRLLNGLELDVAFAAASTASRRIGTAKRMATMRTLMFVSRMQPYGYNFFDDGDAIPDLTELTYDKNVVDARELLTTKRLNLEEWNDVFDNKERDIKFHNDPQIDAFVHRQIEQCKQYGISPHDFLASEFKNGDGNYVPYGFWFEFDFIMDESEAFENAMLKFYNRMMPTLCPDSITGDWTDKLFRPVVAGTMPDTSGKETVDTFNQGCLQMAVPYVDSQGKTYYLWQNVYAGWGFFGDEFTGFHKPNINGSSRTMDELNTINTSGQLSSVEEFRSLIRWAWQTEQVLDSRGNICVDFSGD